jgi:hypothetical protein
MTSIRTCALAIAAVCFIGNQASAQGGPNVKVTSPSETPVAFTINNGPGSAFRVPTGQRLVIEYASAFCSTTIQVLGQPPTPPRAFIQTVTGGVTNQQGIAIPFNPIPINAGATAPIESWELGQLVKIYADAGTDVTVVSGDTITTCTMAFSGLLVTP